MESAGGDRRICRSRLRPRPGSQRPDTSTSPHYVDRKLDFLVKELKGLRVGVAGIQETRWFGKDVSTADVSKDVSTRFHPYIIFHFCYPPKAVSSTLTTKLRYTFY